MHSRHTAATAQDVHDAPTRQCAPCPTATLLTIAAPPTLTTDTEPDAPLLNATATALEAENKWRTVERKATRWKMKAADTEKRRTAAACEKLPTIQNGGWEKKTHQLTNKNQCTTKTWADVIKSGGINVQIVLGNVNLGLTTPTKARGER
jgi:hypothetical protein